MKPGRYFWASARPDVTQKKRDLAAAFKALRWIGREVYLTYDLHFTEWFTAFNGSTPLYSPSAHPAALAAYFSRARKAAGSTSGSSISVEVVAIPPLNMASKTALPTASTNLKAPNKPKS